MAIPLDAEHQVVLDELACRRLLERYSYAEIARDPDLFASVWTEDALFGKVRGRDNIRDACLEFLKHMETIRELRISPAGAHVEVDGDAAIGTYFVVSHLCVPSEEGPERVMIFDASYHAEFARTERLRVAEGELQALTELAASSGRGGSLCDDPLHLGHVGGDTASEGAVDHEVVA